MFVCTPLRVVFNGQGGKIIASEATTDALGLNDADSAVSTVAAFPMDDDRSKVAAGMDAFANGNGTRQVPGEDDTLRLKMVACGDVHTCALDVTGQVWAWGWGEFGQLGLGFSSATYELGLGGRSSKRPTPEPILVEHFQQMQIRAISCGGAFSAAVADVEPGRFDTGNLFLWGANEVGQCAQPPKKPSEVEIPMKVELFAQMRVVVRSVACGVSHVVAVDTAGRAYSWGSSQHGQLGAAYHPPRTFTPPPACETRDGAIGSAAQHRPLLIHSVSRLRIMKAACGLYHSLLVSEGASEVPSPQGRGNTITSTDVPERAGSSEANGLDGGR